MLEAKLTYYLVLDTNSKRAAMKAAKEFHGVITDMVSNADIELDVTLARLDFDKKIPIKKADV